MSNIKWRLPTVTDLQHISKHISDYPNGEVAKLFSTGKYWSNEKYSTNNSPLAWSVSIETGVKKMNKLDAILPVRYISGDLSNLLISEEYHTAWYEAVEKLRFINNCDDDISEYSTPLLIDARPRLKVKCPEESVIEREYILAKDLLDSLLRKATGSGVELIETKLREVEKDYIDKIFESRGIEQYVMVLGVKTRVLNAYTIGTKIFIEPAVDKQLA